MCLEHFLQLDVDIVADDISTTLFNEHFTFVALIPQSFVSKVNFSLTNSSFNSFCYNVFLVEFSSNRKKKLVTLKIFVATVDGTKFTTYN